MNSFDFYQAVARSLNKQRHNTRFIETLTADARIQFKNVPEPNGRCILDEQSVDPFSVIALMLTHRFGKNFTYASARRQMVNFLPYTEMTEADLPDEESWDMAVKVSKEQRKFFNHKSADGEAVPTECWWDLLDCALALADGQQQAEARFTALYDLCRNKNGFTQALHWAAPHFFLSLENAAARRVFSQHLSVRDMSAEQYLEFCRYWQEQAAAEHLSLAEMQALERLRAAAQRH